MRNPNMIHTTKQISKMTFRQIAERAAVLAAKNRHGKAAKIMTHDLYEKINLETRRIQEAATEAETIYQQALTAMK